MEKGQTFPTQYWHLLEDGRVQCDICPRACKLREGQQGLCFVRENQNNAVVLSTYGRSSGFCIDPIEKKPLNHFLPGTPVFSFGTAGCNLTCKFCQNWDISKSREMDTLAQEASPENLALAAHKLKCRSIAFTYNDPVIFHEYAIDVAQACHDKDIKAVAVTAGYMCDKPREEFFSYMDAANIDLKAFSEEFYYKITGAHIDPVLETLKYLKHETNVWFEITTLLIPDTNDSDQEIENMTQWIVENLGRDVPLHFSAFRPEYKMRNKPPTPLSTLHRARNIALKNGIKYAYTGNISCPQSESTYCHSCGTVLIGRDRYNLSLWHLTPEGNCKSCATPCAGVFEPEKGVWGSRRVPVYIKS